MRNANAFCLDGKPAPSHRAQSCNVIQCGRCTVTASELKMLLVVLADNMMMMRASGMSRVFWLIRPSRADGR